MKATKPITYFSVLAVSFLLLALTWIFPPWFYEDNYSLERPAGYHFILSEPPVEPSDVLIKRFSLKEEYKRNFWIHIDFVLLIGQSVFIISSTVGLILLLITFTKYFSLTSKIALAGLSLCCFTAGAFIFACAVYYRYDYLLWSYYKL